MTVTDAAGSFIPWDAKRAREEVEALGDVDASRSEGPPPALATAPHSAMSDLDFSGWVEPYLGAMTHLALRLVGPAAAEDILQDALLRAWRRRETFDPTRGSTKTWLLTLVRREASRLRARIRSRAPLPSEPVGGTDLAEALTLERAIAGLSRRQRMAVVLHYFVDLTVEDCAVVMGCAPGTVKSTLAHARERLSRDLKEQ